MEPIKQPILKAGYERYIHLFAWSLLCFFTVHFRLLRFDPLEYETGEMLVLVVVSTVLNAGVFYLVSHYFMPRIMRKYKRQQMLWGLVGVILAAAFLKSGLLYVLLSLHENQTKVFIREPFLMVFPIISTGLFALLSASYRFAKDWVKLMAQKRALQHQKTIAELGFLKSQINPHFLFNVLNNLYGLAKREKAEHTEEAILKLAAMMRYMLYECSEGQLTLDREVAYLENYIELQRLRIDEKAVAVNFQVEGSLNRLKVHPLLMVPLVENAFKYGVSLRNPSRIDISLKVLEDEALFQVSNTLHLPSETAHREEQIGGFGLDNLERRLNLLDPDQNRLTITKTDGQFVAVLRLPGTKI